MPTGTARIIRDRGEIDTDPPTPVTFIRTDFPSIVDGERVYFERRADDATEAKTVRAATSADELAHLATPSRGLTRQARLLLLEHASDLLARHAPTKGKKHASAASKAHMERLGKSLAAEPDRVGVAALRRAIAQIAAE